MRNTLLISCLLSLFLAPALAQEPDSVPPPPDGHSEEFQVFDNGYIYSPEAMMRLHGIVDSLNLRFKTCELHPRVPALEQASGHYVYGKNPSKALLKALEAGQSFEEILALCPDAEVSRDLLIVRRTFTEAGDEHPTTEFFSPQIVHGGESVYQSCSQKTSAENTRRDLHGRWIFNTWREDKSWEGFFFTTDFQQTILPEAYGRMVQYVDCLIDTNAVIFLGKDDPDHNPWDPGPAGSSAAINAFEARVRSHPTRPFPRDSFVFYGAPNYQEYRARLDAWRPQNVRWLRDTFSKTVEFAALLEAAMQEALQPNAFTDVFEEALEDAGLGAQALDLKRRRRVWGQCSHDESPRLHALDIAELAAETVQWDIFLRAHLDIMNDRFLRMSDGSYAWGRRGTYIQELEALGVNTLDLLLGVCLRADGLPENHYFGDIGRIGRALAEYSNPEELEKRLSGMIADTRLDDFNRVWTYNLFAVYESYLPEGDRKTVSAARLKQAGQTLPPYLASKL